MKTYLALARKSTDKQEVSLDYQLNIIKTHPVTADMRHLGDYADIGTGRVVILRHELKKAITARVAGTVRQLHVQADAIRAKLSDIGTAIGRLMDQVAEGKISPEEYRALKQHQEAKRPALDKELSDIEVQVKHVDKRMIDVLNVIFNLSATFTGGTYAEKDKILAALFPQGFSIKNGLVRTPCVNKALEQMLGHSGTYEHIEITKGTLETENPPKGYQRYEGRTHIGLLHSLAG